MRDTQLALGQPSAHGTYVHLYLNGLYWGQYNLAERPTDSFNADYLGGDKDEYDVIKDFAEVQSGTKEAWNQMIALASADMADEAAYQRIQGNDPDGTPNAHRRGWRWLEVSVDGRRWNPLIAAGSEPAREIAEALEGFPDVVVH